MWPSFPRWSRPLRRSAGSSVPALLLFLTLVLFAAPAAAQSPAPASVRSPFAADTSSLLGTPAPNPAPHAEPIIGRIRVEGNTATDSARVLRSFEVSPGTRYSDELVRRGIRKLFALGLFDDVWVTREPRGSAIDLVIHVVDRRRIGKIEFTGQKKKDAADLEKKLFIRTGETYSPVQVRTQIDTLLKLYRDDGYAQASIDAVPDTTAGPGQMTLRFVVREGEKVKIERIVFAGGKAFPEKRLRKVMRSKQKGLLGGGDIDDEKFTEDRVKLEAWYHNNGYRDARVTGHELVPGSERRRLVLRVSIDEGRLYRIGAVTWTGLQVLTSTEAAKLWEPKAGDLYDASRIERATGMAYAEYSERGHLYVRIEPREELRDSIVDVRYQVTEGEPSRVRYVVISGNKGTRENVIRREIGIHEGDRFKRSALQRTQGNLMRLGIFEDVGLDFGPTDSSDVDVLLKVKEKQVGTASAGAGYTSQSGVTGFLELGHNNVLGNGQSLSLHLERGSNVENYYVSFTEPWFRGTPTLLGASIFNSDRNLDLYDEERVGGSVRLGRPLAWPDYTRGSISYRLEGVAINRQGVLGVADSAALSGIEFGRRLTTSSVELGLLRNSANHPLYPTRGTRLSTNSEFAGGPFGGQIHFHKHRFEGRAYLPSFLKGLATMLRARVGLVGEYQNQRNTQVPLYERFRLGGGTTPDPLRGYDDYQIVPDKNSRFVPSVTSRLVDGSLAGTADSTVYDTTSVRVRYPGGRYFTSYSIEQQFPIVHPLHGVVFFDAGNVWDQPREIQPFKLKTSMGLGFRLEIPLLGNIGFDYGYGFQRDDGPRAVGHFLLGNVNF
ncbi:MAG: outer membrane protein assembly factor BamA [Candidatus Eisenbacteria bacterium]